MQRVYAGHNNSVNSDKTPPDLLFMLGEELRQPLTAIKLLAEKNENVDITIEARRAISTIDNVLLYQRLNRDQTQLDLGPVHVGSVLTGLVHEMRTATNFHDCDLRILVQNGISSVDADREVLGAGLQSLWQAVLCMTPKSSALHWYVSRVKNGIRVSVVNDVLDLSDVKFSSVNKSAGESSQPFQGLAGPSTDLITARGMFSLIGGNLSKSRKNGYSGFAVTLPISKQLSLV